MNQTEAVGLKSTGREVKNLFESLTAGLKQPEKSSTYAEREVRAMEITELRTRKETGLQR